MERDVVRKILDSQIESLSVLLQRRDGISVEKLSDAVEDQMARDGRSVCAESLTRMSYTLEDSVRAREKLDEGTYGVCDRCDEPISRARIERCAEAVRCIPCQNLADHERQTKLQHRL